MATAVNHPRAAGAGYAGVTVACEPTGHRWRVLGQLAYGREMSFVCVQSMLSSWACKSEDLTTDKTDDKDAVLIARLTAQLRCYLPEPVDESGAGYAIWARAASNSSMSTWAVSNRSGTCSSASGPPRWPPHSSRSSRPRGSPR